MSFLELLLRFLAFGIPLYGAYLIALRATSANPKLLAHLWTGGNVAIVAYLTWVAVRGGLSLMRALAYAFAAMVLVSLLTTVTMIVVMERKERSEPPSDSSSSSRP